MGAFADQLNQFANKVDDRTNKVVKKIVFDVGVQLVLKSPVGDAVYWKNKPPPGYVGGRFRGNWQYGFGAVDSSTTEQTDPSGSVSIGRLSEIPDQAAGHVHYLTNSLPYAQAIEEGHSHRQAPTGVVGITVLEFDPIVRAAVAELD